MSASVEVSPYYLTVDSVATIKAVLDTGDRERGRTLCGVLREAMSNRSVFIAPATGGIDREDFRPDIDGGPIAIDDRTVSAVLDRLSAAGHVAVSPAWVETSTEAYLSAARYVTLVRVLRPFSIVSVHYSWSHPAALGFADRWEIVDRSAAVLTGCYLVGEVGDIEPRLIGVSGFDGELADDDVPCWLAEIEGFGASRCAAGCDRCAAEWFAEAGSWEFRPDDGGAVAWCFDDADGFADDGTIACPACHIGRVGFLIS